MSLLPLVRKKVALRPSQVHFSFSLSRRRREENRSIRVKPIGELVDFISVAFHVLRQSKLQNNNELLCDQNVLCISKRLSRTCPYPAYRLR